MVVELSQIAQKNHHEVELQKKINKYNWVNQKKNLYFFQDKHDVICDLLKLCKLQSLAYVIK